ncbi:unnamed protein product [Absidia cylindrospora]
MDMTLWMALMNMTPKTTTPCWVDDSLCQESLMDILTLTPDVTTTDSGNHITESIHLFFEEIGHLTEEPQPIDPSKDYLAEYHERLELQQQRYKKSRRHHIEISRIPSLLDDNDTTVSGISSSSSSFIQHHHDNDYNHHHHHHQTENHHHHHHHHMDSHHPYQHQHHPSDIRSPYFLGGNHQYDHHQHQSYNYGLAALSGLDKYHRHRHQPLH